MSCATILPSVILKKTDMEKSKKTPTDNKNNPAVQKIDIIQKKPRNVDVNTQLLLFALSAGRCEICNESVISDIRTGTDIVWGEKAHIYAFNPGGARTDLDKTYLNNVDNLLLACPNCHEKIDKKALEHTYTAEFLKDIKKRHEARVEIATSIGEERKTKVIKMVANINNERVTTDSKVIYEALLNERRIPSDRNFCEIDFSATSGQNTQEYWKQKSAEIEDALQTFYQEASRDHVEHSSIFAIGPMPLLMHLGSKLNNKISTDLFQRHKDGESWRWKEEESKAQYSFRTIQKGQDQSKVAMLISISGFIDTSKLPTHVDGEFSVYELFLDPEPNYNCIRTKEDLQKFEKNFTSAISEIKNNHKEIDQIEMFPAVPAPVAIICGRSLNKNSDPQIRVYNTALKEPFQYSLTIN